MAREEDFLTRWSRRKSRARDPSREDSRAPDPNAAPVTPRQPAPGGGAEKPATAKAPLPPVESLTPQSDFAPFMAPEVDGDMRRSALKTLFGDPHFNTMDMLDVYVEDFSKPDPIPESWMAKLEQVSRLGDRAGRDREEAERRASAVAQQAAPAADSAAAPPETQAQEDASSAEEGGDRDADQAGRMPPRSEGESRA